MKNEYPIMFGKDMAGTATEEQVGLYRSYVCRCIFHDKEVHRIMMQVGQQRIDLGICVPEGNSFVVYKRIPAKKLLPGEPHFFVDQENTNQIIWKEGELSVNVSRLQQAILCEENGQLAFVLQSGDQNSSSSPTGQ